MLWLQAVGIPPLIMLLSFIIVLEVVILSTLWWFLPKLVVIGQFLPDSFTGYYNLPLPMGGERPLALCIVDCIQWCCHYWITFPPLIMVACQPMVVFLRRNSQSLVVVSENWLFTCQLCLKQNCMMIMMCSLYMLSRGFSSLYGFMDQDCHWYHIIGGPVSPPTHPRHFQLSPNQFWAPAGDLRTSLRYESGTLRLL